MVLVGVITNSHQYIYYLKNFWFNKYNLEQTDYTWFGQHLNLNNLVANDELHELIKQEYPHWLTAARSESTTTEKTPEAGPKHY